MPPILCDSCAQVRKAVSPPGQENRKNTQAQLADRKPSQLSSPPAAPASAASKKASENKNQHLLSATNESKGDSSDVRQQIPYGLAKLSLAGSKSKDKVRVLSITQYNLQLV